MTDSDNDTLKEYKTHLSDEFRTLFDAKGYELVHQELIDNRGTPQCPANSPLMSRASIAFWVLVKGKKVGAKVRPAAIGRQLSDDWLNN